MVARQHGVNENQIYRWKEQFLEGGRQRLNSAKAQTADQRLEAENGQLKKLLGEKALKMEILKNFPVLTMAALAQLYHHYRARISLKGFLRVVGQPHWRLRDYLRVGAIFS